MGYIINLMTSRKKKRQNVKQGSDHGAQLKQLNRISGQVKGIGKMIEERRYCIDILTQLKAVKSSLASIEKKIIGEHLDHCVHRAIASGRSKESEVVMEEIRDLLKSARF